MEERRRGQQQQGVNAMAMLALCAGLLALLLTLPGDRFYPFSTTRSPPSLTTTSLPKAAAVDTATSAGGGGGGGSSSGSSSSSSEKVMKKVLIIGASGAVGKKLAAAIVARRGPNSVIAALRRTPLPASLSANVISHYGIDIRNQTSLDQLFAAHAHEIEAVWNLAAPLSVETAANPELARDVTVGGMERMLNAMKRNKFPKETRVCFSDSIGSFGGEAPRAGASARWLVNHPNQDPGSDYGRQKRAIRQLLNASPFDTRWAIIPGVLHTDATWGSGTTEYALDAAAAAAAAAAVAAAKGHHHHQPYVCPIQPDQYLPMIHVDDLTTGLIALMEARKQNLREPTSGYAIAGFSFNPIELYAEIRKTIPDFEPLSKPGGAIELFARLWPDSLESEAAERDLGFRAQRSMPETLAEILAAHRTRLVAANEQ